MPPIVNTATIEKIKYHPQRYVQYAHIKAPVRLNVVTIIRPIICFLLIVL